MSKFKVGQTVARIGKVVEIAEDSYPVVVTYSDGVMNESFTHEGNCEEKEGEPSLIPFQEADLLKPPVEFKKGDKVFDFRFGTGFIKSLDEGLYPLVIDFQGTTNATYTKSGFLLHHDRTRTLFHTWENPRIITDPYIDPKAEKRAELQAKLAELQAKLAEIQAALEALDE